MLTFPATALAAGVLVAAIVISRHPVAAFISEPDYGDAYVYAPEVGESLVGADRHHGMGGAGNGGTSAVNGGESDCNVCGDTPDSKGGKISGLTFRWDAAVAGTIANIVAEGVTAFQLGIADGGEADPIVADRGYFRANTKFWINDEEIELHTSCSQPIYRGKPRQRAQCVLCVCICILF